MVARGSPTLKLPCLSLQRLDISVYDQAKAVGSSPMFLVLFVFVVTLQQGKMRDQ